MKKKIRVLVPKLVKDTIESDCKVWGITKERLCNEILLKFSLKMNTSYKEEMIFEEKEYIQFNLNKTNQTYYFDLLEQSITTNESEVLRNIFLSYARLVPFLREIYLFRERIIFLNLVNKECRTLKLETPMGIIEGKIEKLFRCEETDYLKIKVNKEQFFIGQVRVLS